MSDNEPRDKPSEPKKNENQETPKPNKSTLYTLLGNAKPAKDETKPKEEKVEENSEKELEKEEKGEKKIQKNMSTLYKIISSQNVIFKKPEEEDDGIEYEDIIENQHFEKDNQMSIVENAIYYVEEEKEDKKKDEQEGKKKEESERKKKGEKEIKKKDEKNLKKKEELKKSTLEITINPSTSDRMKRAKSTIESPTFARKESFFSMRKTNSTNVATELGDFSSIRFSFLDGKHEDKTKDLVYDTIDESKAVLEIPGKDYVAMLDGVADENHYSSPRSSVKSKSLSREFLPHEEYVTGDRNEKSDEESELFYAASEVLNLRPSTPFKKRKDSSDYEDLELENEKLPDIPQKEVMSDDYADVDVNDYCRHREENPKKLNPKDKKAIVRVRSKINRAWKSMKNWINEDKEPKESSYQRTPRVEVIEVIRNEEEKTVEAAPEVPVCSAQSESPRFCFSNENMHFLDIERRENSLSDSGAYVDMSRSNLAENAGDLFSSLTLLRKKRDANSSTPSFRKSRFYPEGQNGFEELRRYIKQGGDFCKELSVILQERSEAENQYAKSLSKLSHKLLKTSKDAVGSVSEAWQRLGAEMEAQSEIHRTFATALSEEVVKPLKQMVESQHRIRKNVENVVDKTGKTLTEWRQAECKSKKQSFLCARENEKLQDTMLDVRNNRNASTLHLHHHNQKNLSEKESAKLDLKRKKAEESVKKADIEYYSFCVRAERCRLDWESAVTRGSHCFQVLEEERLSCLKNLAFCYLNHLKEIGPRLVQSCDRLTEPVESCDVARDIQTVVAMKGSGQPTQEQLLPDFYAEHVTLAMNRERRRQALVKLLQLIRQDLERERRGKEGVENLQRALQQTPNFGAEESQQNVDEKLHHMKSMLIYLEAARYKVQSALSELDGKPKLSHPLASHIHVTRDRQGLQQSVLRVPSWAKNESVGDQSDHGSPDWTGREAGDGTSVQPDSDFDEFSSVGSDKDYQCSVYNVPIISDCNGDSDKVIVGHCRALYEYSAKVYDELNLRIGDIIKIHDKHPDGWWLGELDGVVGIFPATYVEEIHELTP